MAHDGIRQGEPDGGAGTSRLARALGWSSLGLGMAQLAASDRVSELVGLEPSPGTRTTMRAVGVQEVLLGTGILRRERPTGLLWSRVAGDVAHLTMLLAAARDGDGRPERTRRAALAVAAIGMLDLVASIRSSGRESDVVRTVTSTTVNRSPEEVYRAWRDLEALPTFMDHLVSVQTIDARRSRWTAKAPAGRTVEWEAEIIDDVPGHRLAWRSRPGADVDNRGTVRLDPAPGDRGTEVTLEIEYVVPGGRAGRALARILGEHPEQQAKDDLRRFKQVVETGEVVRSDGSPDGSRSARQWHQEDALPRG